MGNSEAEKSTKSEKPASPSQAQATSGVHVYPDWSAVQACYGPGAVPPGMPPPYYGPAVTSGHPYPYMWAPPQMMPPYGSPYAAMYPQGGIYGHSPAPGVATPLSLETPTRSSGNNSGSAKKLKDSDGRVVSGNGHAESGGEGGLQGQSQSTDCGTEGSGESDDSTAQGDQNGKSSNGVGYAGNNGTRPYAALEAGRGVGMGQVVTGVPKGSAVGFQDEREIKREKRKQSNRESARRSRLRKQAEMEELGKKVDNLTVENLALRSEINKLVEDSEKLRTENAELMEKLKGASVLSVPNSGSPDGQDKAQISTENFLSKVENSGSNAGNHPGSKGK